MSVNKMEQKQGFAQKHPRLYLFIGLLILLSLISMIIFTLFLICNLIVKGIDEFILWISSLSSKLDAVIVVSLITGTVSILGVILSSIVAKAIDYKRQRQEYLTQKRENAYCNFVDIVYKITRSGNQGFIYSKEDIINDITVFSSQITLWGSSQVVRKWVKFRENTLKDKNNNENLLIVEDIMNSMRKDLGLKKVKKGELLSFFINDTEKIIKK